ncbi:MAG: alpha/beta hydrolase [Rhodospirillaceae bacterium]|nr:alpha/beta hydrolase [Rhodospirillaceae bacterium]
MSTIDFVDAELREALEQRPRLKLSDEALPKSRAFIHKLAAATPKPDLPDLGVSEMHVDSIFGAAPIRILMYKPRGRSHRLPAFVHVHGGGFVMGAPEMRDVENRILASKLNCVIVSVDYRLAPEAPYPAALHDVYAVLVWLNANALALDVDPARIGIKGESGGGGIAAGVALYARDKNGPPLAFQHFIYPMIDDRTAIRTDLNPYVGEFVWTQEHNLFGWRALLGQEPGRGDVSPYAAASRADDLSKLPPTYIAVGALDLFLEENMDYAHRLSRAGVPVELHVYPGAYHGFQAAAQARVSQQADRDSFDSLLKCLHG